MISADLGHISNYPHRGSETPLNEGGGEKPKFLNKRG